MNYEFNQAFNTTNSNGMNSTSDYYHGHYHHHHSNNWFTNSSKMNFSPSIDEDSSSYVQIQQARMNDVDGDDDDHHHQCENRPKLLMWGLTK